MPTDSNTPIAELDHCTPVIEIEEPKRKQKQVFHRAIKRDYQRQNFHKKTR